MKSDRELLELTAKACGYRYKFSAGGSCIVDIDGYWRGWNPIRNDYENSILKEKLGITVAYGTHYGDGCTAESHLFDVPSCTSFRDSQSEASRIAVVIVAANISELMP